MATPTDTELLESCRRGDPDAWTLLIDRYQRLVYTVALRNGVGRDDAADVTQSVFIALLESTGGIRSDERLASWLMTVARRQAWRLRARRDRETLQPDPGVDVAEQLDAIGDWERVAVVHEALGRLGKPCRDLLVRLYFDPGAPSYAQIAARLGIAIGTIGPMRARCLSTVRKLLAGEPL